ncbi:halocyanin [Halobacteriales archaeon QS_3_64_16]|nr:MAG: halocyanin [Halobacteriales archaeon QS_3_64_16]
MATDRPTRRRLLRSVAGIGIGVGIGGCIETGTQSENEPSGSDTGRSTTPGSQATRSTTTTADPTATEGTTSEDTTRAKSDATGESPSPNTETTSAASAERGAYTVGMYTDLYFDPIGLFVEPGTTVSFELVSGVHSATAYHPDNQGALDQRIPSGAPSWNTGRFGEEGAFRNVTFETSGTHDYYCIPHKQLGMVGRIVVGEPGGPATESPNPDGELPDSERILEEGSIPYEEFRASGR